jgi:hypothetical protein
MAKPQARLPGVGGRLGAATECICKPPAIDLWAEAIGGWLVTDSN